MKVERSFNIAIGFQSVKAARTPKQETSALRQDTVSISGSCQEYVAISKSEQSGVKPSTKSSRLLEALKKDTSFIEYKHRSFINHPIGREAAKAIILEDENLQEEVAKTIWKSYGLISPDYMIQSKMYVPASYKKINVKALLLSSNPNDVYEALTAYESVLCKKAATFGLTENERLLSARVESVELAARGTFDQQMASVFQAIEAEFKNEGMEFDRNKSYEFSLDTSVSKRSKGFHYENPHCKNNDGLWSPSTVARMLQNPLYIGVMRQGRQKVISYKVHKRAAVPEEEWFIVENAVPAIIDKDTFEAAQSLHRRDTRTAPGKQEVYLFSGFIRCADCGKSMVRHTAKNLVYYQCRTNRDKSKAKCTKHSIRLDVLEQAVLAAVQKQIEFVDSLSEIIKEINDAPVVHTESLRLNALLEQRTREFEKVAGVLDGLYMDWKNGDITRDQYRRMKVRFEEQVQQLQETIDHIRQECETIARGIDDDNPYLTAFLKHRNIQSLSRGLLVELVNAIYVHEDKSIEIEFNFADQYRRIAEHVENNHEELCINGGKAV